MQKMLYERALNASKGIESKAPVLKEWTPSIPYGTPARSSTPRALREPQQLEVSRSLDGVDLPPDVTAETVLAAFRSRFVFLEEAFELSGAMLERALERNILAGNSGFITAVSCLKLATMAYKPWSLDYFQESLCAGLSVEWAPINSACNELYLRRHDFRDIFEKQGANLKNLRLVPSLQASVTPRFILREKKIEPWTTVTRQRLQGTEWWLRNMSTEEAGQEQSEGIDGEVKSLSESLDRCELEQTLPRLDARNNEH